MSEKHGPRGGITSVFMPNVLSKEAWTGVGVCESNNALICANITFVEVVLYMTCCI